MEGFPGYLLAHFSKHIIPVGAVKFVFLLWVSIYIQEMIVPDKVSDSFGGWKPFVLILGVLKIQMPSTGHL